MEAATHFYKWRYLWLGNTRFDHFFDYFSDLLCLFLFVLLKLLSVTLLPRLDQDDGAGDASEQDNLPLAEELRVGLHRPVEGEKCITSQSKCTPLEGSCSELFALFEHGNSLKNDVRKPEHARETSVGIL